MDNPTVKFKVWIQVEQWDPGAGGSDEYTDVSEPLEGSLWLESDEEASAIMYKLHRIAAVMAGESLCCGGDHCCKGRTHDG